MNLLPRVDKLIIGGGMAFTFLKAQGWILEIHSWKEPIILRASPSSSKLRCKVLRETSPEPMVAVPCRKPGDGFFEVKLHRQRIDDFAMVVVVDHFRDRQPVGFIAETVGIKIFGHRVGIQRGAVGEGDAWTQRKGVFGFVGVRYQVP